MKTARMLGIVGVAVGLVLTAWTGQFARAAEMGTAFTYQGHLYDANYVANGAYDLQFKLYDSNDPCDCNQIGADVNVGDMEVIDGYFTVGLDFNDANAFNGDARWLEIGVRPGEQEDPNGYTALLPRQEITPTPYSLHTNWLLVDTALNNVFVGKGAGASNTSGPNNLAIGSYALYTNWYGRRNTAIGSHALYSNIVSDNTAIGSHALYSNWNGDRNTAIGGAALYSNTGGHFNTAIGSLALHQNTSGSFNMAIGEQALGGNTLGCSNTAMGSSALSGNDTGSWNTALGYRALEYNSTGHNNIAVGSQALYNTTGPNNMAVGNMAGYSNSSGVGNVFLGHRAGYYETGSDKLYIANSDANTLIYGEFDTGKVDVGGTVQMTGIKMTTDPHYGYVLKSDANGVGTWQPLAEGDDGDWTISDNNMYAAVGGNVGIGTTSPSQSLDVSGNAAISGSVGIGTASPSQSLDVSGNAAISGSVGIGTASPAAKLHVVGDTEITGSLYAGSGSTILFVDDANANVGIGTVAPGSKLEVVGNVEAQGFSISGIPVGTSSDTYWSANDGKIYYNSGDVGIGTTSPAEMLHLSNTGSVGVFIEADTDNSNEADQPSIILSQDGGVVQGKIGFFGSENKLSVYNAYGDDLKLGTNNDSNMVVISPTGYVGIGTTSPRNILDIRGNSVMPQVILQNLNTTDGHVGFELQRGNSVAECAISLKESVGTEVWKIGMDNSPGGTQSDFAIKTTNNAAAEFTIKTSGNVGIGTTSPNGKLDVNGSIYQRGSSLHADYVFEDGYGLESIEEHSQFMWQNKHLKAIPERRLDEGGQEIIEVGAHRKGIVEELEKAHIYIEQLHRRIAKLEAIVGELAEGREGEGQ